MRSIKIRDREIRDETSNNNSVDDSLPPVRSLSKTIDTIDSPNSITNNSKRIASYDYQQWDKYDAGMTSVHSVDKFQ